MEQGSRWSDHRRSSLVIVNGDNQTGGRCCGIIVVIVVVVRSFITLFIPFSFDRWCIAIAVVAVVVVVVVVVVVSVFRRSSVQSVGVSFISFRGLLGSSKSKFFFEMEFDAKDYFK